MERKDGKIELGGLSIGCQGCSTGNIGYAKGDQKDGRKSAKSSLEEEKADTIMEPSPQPSMGSYYNFLEARNIIPQKFTVPLFLALEEERVRTHTWMKIAKS